MLNIPPEVISLIQTVAVLAGGLGFIYAIRSDLNTLKNDINHLREGQKALTEAFTQLGKVLTQVAVQDVRINAIEKKIDELAHGEGLVVRKK